MLSKEELDEIREQYKADGMPKPWKDLENMNKLIAHVDELEADRAKTCTACKYDYELNAPQTIKDLEAENKDLDDRLWEIYKVAAGSRSKVPIIKKIPRKPNSTQIYGKGYVAGYNQARVDGGQITQEEADNINKKEVEPEED